VNPAVSRAPARAASEGHGVVASVTPRASATHRVAVPVVAVPAARTYEPSKTNGAAHRLSLVIGVAPTRMKYPLEPYIAISEPSATTPARPPPPARRWSDDHRRAGGQAGLCRSRLVHAAGDRGRPLEAWQLRLADEAVAAGDVPAPLVEVVQGVEVARRGVIDDHLAGEPRDEATTGSS